MENDRKDVPSCQKQSKELSANDTERVAMLGDYRVREKRLAMITLDFEIIKKCREHGLNTVHEIDEYVKKFGIESNEELEKVLNGEQAVYAITVPEPTAKCRICGADNSDRDIVAGVCIPCSFEGGGRSMKEVYIKGELPKSCCKMNEETNEYECGFYNSEYDMCHITGTPNCSEDRIHDNCPLRSINEHDKKKNVEIQQLRCFAEKHLDWADDFRTKMLILDKALKHHLSHDCCGCAPAFCQSCQTEYDKLIQMAAEANEAFSAEKEEE